MRKKVVTTLIAVITAASFASGCGRKEEPTENESESEEIQAEPTDTASGNTYAESTAGMPAVYMTADISSEGLISVYDALQASPAGKIAVKLSTGEPGSNYLGTDLIGKLVQSFEDPTIVECNTAYGGTGGSMWGGDQDAFLESMAEAGKSVVDYLDGNILYINVMNRLSVDCDCDGNPAEPDMHDIGILASYDPVALDQACIDLVYRAQDGGFLVERIESRNGLHTLEHAENIGLGSRTYELVGIDG